MIVDTSALIAVLHNEPEAALFTELLIDNPARMSAANWLEAAMVADANVDPETGDRLDQLIAVTEIEVVDVTAALATKARAAFRRYGRGSGSPARLNFGDCFAYALSAMSDEPLLFKGNDFSHTDVLRASSVH